MVDNLISRQVDGLIVASSGHSDDIYARIHDRLPVVQLDRHIGESRLPMVISDACKATAELVQDMAEDCGRRSTTSAVCWISPQPPPAGGLRARIAPGRAGGHFRPGPPP